MAPPAATETQDGSIPLQDESAPLSMPAAADLDTSSQRATSVLTMRSRSQASPSDHSTSHESSRKRPLTSSQAEDQAPIESPTKRQRTITPAPHIEDVSPTHASSPTQSTVTQSNESSSSKSGSRLDRSSPGCVSDLIDISSGEDIDSCDDNRDNGGASYQDHLNLDDTLEELDEMDFDEVADAADKKALADSKMIRHFHDETMERFLANVTDEVAGLLADFLPLIPIEVLKKSEKVSLPNWDLRPDFKVYPYQLVFAMLALRKELQRKGIPGGILADDCGGGKTVQMILFHTICFLYSRNYKEVLRAWAKKSTAHLPKSEQNEDAKCPSYNAQPIACYCQPKSRRKFYFDAPRYGATIVFTTPAGIASFTKDTMAMFDFSQPSSKRPRIAMFHSTSPRDPNVGPLSKAEMDELAVDPDWSEHMDMLEEPVHTFKVGSTERRGPYEVQKLVGPRHQPNKRLAVGPTIRCNRFMIVSTPLSFSTQVEKPFLATMTAVWKPTEGRPKRPHVWEESISTLVAARALWDECHNFSVGATMKTSITHLSDDFRAHSEKPFAVWGVSGTPFTRNPFALFELMTSWLRSPNWDDDENLKILSPDNLSRWVKSWDKCREAAQLKSFDPSTDTTLQELLNNLKDVTKLFIVCRRTEATVWHDGNPVIPKSSQLTLDCKWCLYTEKWASYISTLESALGAEVRRRAKEAQASKATRTRKENPKDKGLFSTSYHTVRIAATFPELANFFLGDQVKLGSLTKGLTTANEKLDKYFAEPFLYKSTITHLCAGNGKLRRIFKIIDGAKATPRKDGSTSKVIVASRYPFVRCALQVALSSRYGAKTICTYNSNKDRDAVLDTWNSNDDVVIMLGALRAMGESINLQRAHHAILVEPPNTRNELDQFFKRVDRIGQTEPKVSGYMLINEDSMIDYRKIKQLNEMRTLSTTIINVNRYELETGKPQPRGGEFDLPEEV